MVAMKDIQELGLRIAREFEPRRIALFGSYAGGTPGPDSDVDLLVIFPHTGKPVQKYLKATLISSWTLRSHASGLWVFSAGSALTAPAWSLSRVMDKSSSPIEDYNLRTATSPSWNSSTATTRSSGSMSGIATGSSPRSIRRMNRSSGTAAKSARR